MDLAKWNWTEVDLKQGHQYKWSRKDAVSKAFPYMKNKFNQFGIVSFVSVSLVDNNGNIKSFALTVSWLYKNKKFVKKLKESTERHSALGH